MDEDRVANVFSFGDPADQCCVVCDDSTEDAFIVKSWEHEKDKVNIKFPRDEASRLCSHRFLAAHTNRNKQRTMIEKKLTL